MAAILCTTHHFAHTIITPYTSTITPSSTYLSDPLNTYAHLGMPKPLDNSVQEEEREGSSRDSDDHRLSVCICFFLSFLVLNQF